MGNFLRFYSLLFTRAILLILVFFFPSKIFASDLLYCGFELPPSQEQILYSTNGGGDDASDKFYPSSVNPKTGTNSFVAEDISTEASVVFNTLDLRSYTNIRVGVFVGTTGDFESGDNIKGYYKTNLSSWLLFFSIEGDSLDNLAYTEKYFSISNGSFVDIKIIFNESASGTGDDSEKYFLDSISVSGDFSKERLLINEVFTGGFSGSDYIEFVNASSYPIDISGMKLEIDGVLIKTFPQMNNSIGVDEIFTLTFSGASSQDERSVSEKSLGEGSWYEFFTDTSASVSSIKGEITFKNSSSIILDTVCYIRSLSESLPPLSGVLAGHWNSRLSNEMVIMPSSANSISRNSLSDSNNALNWTNVTPTKGEGLPTIDTNSPFIETSYPYLSEVGATTVSFIVKANEASVLYCVAVSSSSPIPSASMLKLGVDSLSNNAPSISMSGGNYESLPCISNLTTASTYNLYMVLEDTSSNLSAIYALSNITPSLEDSVAPKPYFVRKSPYGELSNSFVFSNETVGIVFSEEIFFSNATTLTEAIASNIVILREGDTNGNIVDVSLTLEVTNIYLTPKNTLTEGSRYCLYITPNKISDSSSNLMTNSYWAFFNVFSSSYPIYQSFDSNISVISNEGWCFGEGVLFENDRYHTYPKRLTLSSHPSSYIISPLVYGGEIITFYVRADILKEVSLPIYYSNAYSGGWSLIYSNEVLVSNEYQPISMYINSYEESRFKIGYPSSSILLDTLSISAPIPDTAPPVLYQGYPYVSVNSTNFKIVAKGNEYGKLYYIVLDTNSIAPSSTSLKNATYSYSPVYAHGSFVLIAGRESFSDFIFTSNVGKTNFSLFVLAEDNGISNTGDLVNESSIYKLDINLSSEDISAPVFLSTPSVEPSFYSASVSLLSDEDCIFYLLVTDSDSLTPSISQITNPTSYEYSKIVWASSVFGEGGKSTYLTAVDMNSETEYVLYIIAKDTNGNIQPSFTRCNFKTEAENYVETLPFVDNFIRSDNLLNKSLNADIYVNSYNWYYRFEGNAYFAWCLSDELFHSFFDTPAFDSSSSLKLTIEYEASNSLGNSLLLSRKEGMGSVVGITNLNLYETNTKAIVIIPPFYNAENSIAFLRFSLLPNKNTVVKIKSLTIERQAELSLVDISSVITNSRLVRLNFSNTSARLLSVYRSENNSDWQLVGSGVYSFSDTKVLPSKMYFYKASVLGSEQFCDTVVIKTLDEEVLYSYRNSFESDEDASWVGDWKSSSYNVVDGNLSIKNLAYSYKDAILKTPLICVSNNAFISFSASVNNSNESLCRVYMLEGSAKHLLYSNTLNSNMRTFSFTNNLQTKTGYLYFQFSVTNPTVLYFDLLSLSYSPSYSVYPQNGDCGISKDVSCRIRLDYPLNSSKPEELIVLRKSYNGSYSLLTNIETQNSLSSDLRVMTLTPKKPLEEGGYYEIALLDGIEDINGGKIKPSVLSRFTVEGGVVINEIVFSSPAPNGGISQDGWIEIHNPSAYSISLSNISITSGQNSVEFSKTIDAGGFILVSSKNALTYPLPSYSNLFQITGESIILRDSFSNALDKVYLQNINLPPFPYSLERLSPITSSLSNWRINNTLIKNGSNAYGAYNASAGKTNSVSIVREKNLSVYFLAKEAVVGELPLVLVYPENVFLSSGKFYIRRFDDDSLVNEIDASSSLVRVNNNEIHIEKPKLSLHEKYYISCDNSVVITKTGKPFNGISVWDKTNFSFITGSREFYEDFESIPLWENSLYLKTSLNAGKQFSVMLYGQNTIVSPKTSAAAIIFSSYGTQNGQVLLEYSYDKSNWQSLEAFLVSAHRKTIYGDLRMLGDNFYLRLRSVCASVYIDDIELVTGQEDNTPPKIIFRFPKNATVFSGMLSLSFDENIKLNDRYEFQNVYARLSNITLSQTRLFSASDFLVSQNTMYIEVTNIDTNSVYAFEIDYGFVCDLSERRNAFKGIGKGEWIFTGANLLLDEDFENEFPPEGFVLNSILKASIDEYFGNNGAYFGMSNSYIVLPMLSNASFITFISREDSLSKLVLEYSNSTGWQEMALNQNPLDTSGIINYADLSLLSNKSTYLKIVSYSGGIYIDNIKVFGPSRLDGLPPVVIYCSHSNLSTVRRDFKIVFNKDIFAKNGFIYLREEPTGVIFDKWHIWDTNRVFISSNTLSFISSNLLEETTAYSIQIDDLAIAGREGLYFSGSTNNEFGFFTECDKNLIENSRFYEGLDKWEREGNLSNTNGLFFSGVYGAISQKGFTLRKDRPLYSVRYIKGSGDLYLLDAIGEKVFTNSFENVFSSNYTGFSNVIFPLSNSFILAKSSVKTIFREGDFSMVGLWLSEFLPPSNWAFSTPSSIIEITALPSRVFYRADTNVSVLSFRSSRPSNYTVSLINRGNLPLSSISNIIIINDHNTNGMCDAYESIASKTIYSNGFYISTSSLSPFSNYTVILNVANTAISNTKYGTYVAMQIYSASYEDGGKGYSFISSTKQSLVSRPPKIISVNLYNTNQSVVSLNNIKSDTAILSVSLEESNADGVGLVEAIMLNSKGEREGIFYLKKDSSNWVSSNISAFPYSDPVTHTIEIRAYAEIGITNSEHSYRYNAEYASVEITGVWPPRLGGVYISKSNLFRASDYRASIYAFAYPYAEGTNRAFEVTNISLTFEGSVLDYFSSTNNTNYFLTRGDWGAFSNITNKLYINAYNSGGAYKRKELDIFVYPHLSPSSSILLPEETIGLSNVSAMSISEAFDGASIKTYYWDVVTDFSQIVSKQGAYSSLSFVAPNENTTVYVYHYVLDSFGEYSKTNVEGVSVSRAFSQNLDEARVVNTIITPTADRLILDYATEDAIATIYTADGRRVDSFSLSESRQWLIPDYLSAGVYVIHLKDGFSQPKIIRVIIVR